MSDTRVAIAARLNGITYDELRRGVPIQIAREAQAAGCVIIYGMSDDELEFRGAINDEVGAWEGATAYIANGKLLERKCDECKDCELYDEARKQAIRIDAHWDHMGYSWFITASSSARSPFIVYEDGETYCLGIVLDV